MQWRPLLLLGLVVASRPKPLEDVEMVELSSNESQDGELQATATAEIVKSAENDELDQSTQPPMRADEKPNKVETLKVANNVSKKEIDNPISIDNANDILKATNADSSEGDIESADDEDKPGNNGGGDVGEVDSGYDRDDEGAATEDKMMDKSRETDGQVTQKEQAEINKKNKEFKPIQETVESEEKREEEFSSVPPDVRARLEALGEWHLAGFTVDCFPPSWFLDDAKDEKSDDYDDDANGSEEGDEGFDHGKSTKVPEDAEKSNQETELEPGKTTSQAHVVAEEKEGLSSQAHDCLPLILLSGIEEKDLLHLSIHLEGQQKEAELRRSEPQQQGHLSEVGKPSNHDDDDDDDDDGECSLDSADDDDFRSLEGDEKKEEPTTVAKSSYVSLTVDVDPPSMVVDLDDADDRAVQQSIDLTDPAEDPDDMEMSDEDEGEMTEEQDQGIESAKDAEVKEEKELKPEVNDEGKEESLGEGEEEDDSLANVMAEFGKVDIGKNSSKKPMVNIPKAKTRSFLSEPDATDFKFGVAVIAALWAYIVGLLIRAYLT